MAFRLTFNKPTIERYFAGEDATGVRVKIEDGVVQFLPVADKKGADVLPIELRTRGGAEAMVEGTMADDLQQALNNPDGPFFTLSRIKGGWLAAKPWPKDSAPPKFEPHVRSWAPKLVAAASASPSLRADSLSAFVDLVRAAEKTVNDFAASKRPGRPPREVLEAKQALDDFRALAAHYTPQGVDVGLVNQAQALLAKALTGARPIEPEAPAAVEPEARTVTAQPPKNEQPKKPVAKAAQQPAQAKVPTAQAKAPTAPAASTPAPPKAQVKVAQTSKAESPKSRSTGEVRGPQDVSQAEVDRVAKQLGARITPQKRGSRDVTVIRKGGGQRERRSVVHA